MGDAIEMSIRMLFVTFLASILLLSKLSCYSPRNAYYLVVNKNNKNDMKVVTVLEKKQRKKNKHLKKKFHDDIAKFEEEMFGSVGNDYAMDNPNVETIIFKGTKSSNCRMQSNFYAGLTLKLI